MKRDLLAVLLMLALPIYTFGQDAMCENLKKVVDSGQEYFKEIRGEETRSTFEGCRNHTISRLWCSKMALRC